MVNDDHVPVKVIDDPQEVAKFTSRWIAEAEAQIERAAAETGRAQSRTLWMEGDGGKVYLRVDLTCEPRQFAKRVVTGELAAAFKSPEP